jgi:hypothetical protein
MHMRGASDFATQKRASKWSLYDVLPKSRSAICGMHTIPSMFINTADNALKQARGWPVTSPFRLLGDLSDDTVSS